MDLILFVENISSIAYTVHAGGRPLDETGIDVSYCKGHCFGAVL